MRQIQPGEFMAGRVWVVGLVFLACVAGGAGQNPMAGDPKAAKAGEYEFRINCARDAGERYQRPGRWHDR